MQKTQHFFRAATVGFTLSFFGAPVFAQSQPGYTFTATATTEKNGKPDGKPVLLKTSVAGKNGRINIMQGDGDSLKTGDYIVTTDGGVTFWTVSVKKREAKQISPEGIRRLVAKQNFDVKSVSLTPPVPVGAGETVGGIATEQYRVSRRYTFSVRELFFSAKVAVAETWDFDIASAKAGVPDFNPAVSFLALTNSTPLFKNDAFVATGYAQIMPKGFVVKVVAEGVSTEGKKKERETTTVICDAPVAANLPDSLFAVPDGIKKK